MKKLLPFLIGFAFLLTACRSAGTPEPAAVAETCIPTDTEYVASDNSYIFYEGGEITLEAVCRRSAVLVRAEYLGYNEFGPYTSVHLFRVEEEYTDRIREPVIHVYEDRDTSFCSGKTYYLFLTGFLSCFYPHPVYARVYTRFLVGEDEAGYTFYRGQTLGLDRVGNIGRYLREEIAAKGAYDREPEPLLPESPADACEHAEAILAVTVSRVEESSSRNPYVRYAGFAVDRVLKGEDLPDETAAAEDMAEEILAAAGFAEPLAQVPADVNVGDRLLLFFRRDPRSGRLEPYSTQYTCLRADSDAGREVLARFS